MVPGTSTTTKLSHPIIYEWLTIGGQFCVGLMCII